MYNISTIYQLIFYHFKRYVRYRAVFRTISKIFCNERYFVWDTKFGFNRYRRKRPKVDASIFDSVLSHTRRSDASEKREENSVVALRSLLDVFACGQVSSPRLYRLRFFAMEMFFLLHVFYPCDRTREDEQNLDGKKSEICQFIQNFNLPRK